MSPSNQCSYSGSYTVKNKLNLLSRIKSCSENSNCEGLLRPLRGYRASSEVVSPGLTLQIVRVSPAEQNIICCYYSIGRKNRYLLCSDIIFIYV